MACRPARPPRSPFCSRKGGRRKRRGAATDGNRRRRRRKTASQQLEEGASALCCLSGRSVDRSVTVSLSSTYSLPPSPPINTHPLTPTMGIANHHRHRRHRWSHVNHFVPAAAASAATTRVGRQMVVPAAAANWNGMDRLRRRDGRKEGHLYNNGISGRVDRPIGQRRRGGTVVEGGQGVTGRLRSCPVPSNETKKLISKYPK